MAACEHARAAIVEAQSVAARLNDEPAHEKLNTMAAAVTALARKAMREAG